MQALETPEGLGGSGASRREGLGVPAGVRAQHVCMQGGGGYWMLCHGPFPVTCQHYLGHMHVFKVQTRVKHVMHAWREGPAVLLLELGTVDVCICHNRNRNTSTSNVKKIQSDKRSAERPGAGQGGSAWAQAAAARAPVPAGATSMHRAFWGQTGGWARLCSILNEGGQWWRGVL